MGDHEHGGGRCGSAPAHQLLPGICLVRLPFFDQASAGKAAGGEGLWRAPFLRPGIHGPAIGEGRPPLFLLCPVRPCAARGSGHGPVPGTDREEAAGGGPAGGDDQAPVGL